MKIINYIQLKLKILLSLIIFSTSCRFNTNNSIKTKEKVSLKFIFSDTFFSCTSKRFEEFVIGSVIIENIDSTFNVKNLMSNRMHSDTIISKYNYTWSSSNNIVFLDSTFLFLNNKFYSKFISDRHFKKDYILKLENKNRSTSYLCKIHQNTIIENCKLFDSLIINHPIDWD